MQMLKLALAAALPLAVLATAGAEAQSGSSTRFSYHHSYYDRGYDRFDYRYQRRACETRSGGGLGIGAVLGGNSVLSASIRLGGRFTECDERQYAWASAWSADHSQPAYWENPRTGARGAVHPRDYYRQGSRTCASFESESWSGHGDYDRGEFEMCRNGNGEWEFAGSWEHRR